MTLYYAIYHLCCRTLHDYSTTWNYYTQTLVELGGVDGAWSITIEAIEDTLPLHDVSPQCSELVHVDGSAHVAIEHPWPQQQQQIILNCSQMMNCCFNEKGTHRPWGDMFQRWSDSSWRSWVPVAVPPPRFDQICPRRPHKTNQLLPGSPEEEPAEKAVREVEELHTGADHSLVDLAVPEH